MKKKILAAAVILAGVLLLSGCGTRTIDEMYSIPRRSPQNSNLREVVESAMEGVVYSAPVSGENREPVQTADLDGDGSEEYLVFARSEKDNALKILLFRQNSEKRFEHWETLSCKGTAFEQILYAPIDDRGGKEMIVGTRINERITKIVSLYSFGSGHSEKISSMIYQRLAICDLNQDGLSELMVVQNDGARAGYGIARVYSFVDGSVVGSVEAKLSGSPEQIRRIVVNRLTSGEEAVFVASSSNEQSLITDIFALRDDVFTNISLSGESEISMQTLRNDYIYAEDIDSDGLLELPGLVSMMHNTTQQNLLRWYSMDISGMEYNKLYTFHNLSDGWYIEVNSEWIDRFSAERNGNIYTFFMWNHSYGSAVPVFSVYSFREKDRDIQADAQNRFALYRGEDVVYAAKLESGSAIYGITADYLQSAFHLIHQEWNAAES